MAKTKKKPVKKGGSPTSTATKTSTSTKTATSTKADTKHNVTVTGGAGDGDTIVTIAGAGVKKAVKGVKKGKKFNGRAFEKARKSHFGLNKKA